MTSMLWESEPLEGGLRRLAVESVDVALAGLDNPEDRDVAIHTVRKQCKQLRALLRLFGDALGPKRRRESRLLRDLSRSLAHARDSKVALDVHDELTTYYESVLSTSVATLIRQALTDLRQSRAEPDVDALRHGLMLARSRARHWSLQHDADELLACGLTRAYRRARKASRAASARRTPEAMHEARKRAKDYWYQLEFVARCWPDVALERTAPVRRLTDLLGDAQDLAIYQSAVEETARLRSPRAVEVLSALADSRRRELETAGLALAAQVFADKPREFGSRLGRRISADRQAR